MDWANTLLGLLWRFFSDNTQHAWAERDKCEVFNKHGIHPHLLPSHHFASGVFWGCQKVRGLHGRREIPVFKRIPLGIYRRDRQCHCVWLSQRAARFTMIKSLSVAGPGPNDWG